MSSRPRPDDDQVVLIMGGTGRDTDSSGDFGVGRVDQHLPVEEDQYRQLCRILFDVSQDLLTSAAVLRMKSVRYGVPVKQVADLVATG